MNKLVLIGNGFDLAHGLKTRYSDFLLWYLDNAMGNLRRETVYDDCLLTLTPSGEKPIYKLNSLKEFHDLQTNGTFVFSPKNDFIKNIFSHAIQYNWVDLENQYYLSLISLFKYIEKKNIESVPFIHNQVITLNNCFDYIKIKLSEYLLTIDNKNVNTDNGIEAHFYKELKVAEENSIDGEILFLNFNYTSTLKLYKDLFSAHNKFRVNYIHGKLDSVHNPIIFG